MTRTPAWPNRTELANQTPTTTGSDGALPEGIRSDANKIGQILHDDLARRNKTIARNDTATMLICNAAALEELMAFCQEAIYLNIRNARNHGATWREIGDAFGVSARAAMDRYNKSTVESRRRSEARRAAKRRNTHT